MVHVKIRVCINQNLQFKTPSERLLFISVAFCTDGTKYHSWKYICKCCPDTSSALEITIIIPGATQKSPKVILEKRYSGFTDPFKGEWVSSGTTQSAWYFREESGGVVHLRDTEFRLQELWQSYTDNAHKSYLLLHLGGGVLFACESVILSSHPTYEYFIIHWYWCVS